MKVAILIFAAFTFLAPIAHAVPNTFSAGESVSASKMNQNFTALENALGNTISQLTITTRYAGYNFGTTYGSLASEVATASCLEDEVITGGTCSCITENSNFNNTNFGQVSFCTIAGNNIVGSCMANSMVYDDGLYGPPISIFINCAKVISTAAPVSLAAFSEDIELIELQDKISEQMRILQNRTK